MNFPVAQQRGIAVEGLHAYSTKGVRVYVKIYVDRKIALHSCKIPDCWHVLKISVLEMYREMNPWSSMGKHLS